MNLEGITKKFLLRDLTGDEIRQLVGREPVVYSDLAKYSNIDSLLGKWGYVVLLYQKTRFDGHYVSLFRDKSGAINFQDSYGFGPDEPINMGLLAYDKPLPRYLSSLLESERVIVNRYDYQKGKTTADCGRHACLRIRLRNLSNDQYRAILATNRSAFLTPDNCAVILTLLSLNDFTQ
jgi:hypothetical protein